MIHKRNEELKKDEQISRFLIWLQASHSKATVLSYYYGLRAYQKYLYVINKNVTECTIDDFSNFNLWMEGRQLRGGARNHYMGCVKALWRWLYRQKLVNFEDGLIPLPIRNDTKSYEYLPYDEFSKMANSFGEMYPKELRNKALLFFLYFSGVRLGECLNMNVSDLELDRFDDNGNAAPRAKITTFKRKNHTRYVYWTEETTRLLRKWLQMRQEILRYNFSDSSALWITLHINDGGSRLHRSEVQRMFRERREKFHVDRRYTAHSCRHGFGYNGVKNNVNLRYLQELMGHAKISSTQVYMQIEQKDVENEYRKIYQNQWSKR